MYLAAKLFSQEALLQHIINQIQCINFDVFIQSISYLIWCREDITSKVSLFFSLSVKGMFCDTTSLR